MDINIGDVVVTFNDNNVNFKALNREGSQFIRGSQKTIPFNEITKFEIIDVGLFKQRRIILETTEGSVVLEAVGAFSEEFNSVHKLFTERLTGLKPIQLSVATMESNINISVDDYNETFAPIIADQYAIVALNTTGVNPYEGHRIIEIGVTVLDAAYNTVEHHETMVNPGFSIKDSAYHNITSGLLTNAPKFDDINSEVLALLNNKLLVTFPADFICSFLNNEMTGKNITKNNALDLCLFAKYYKPDLDNHRLDTVMSEYGIFFDDLKNITNKSSALQSLLKAMMPTHENTVSVASENHVAYFNPTSVGYTPLFVMWEPKP